MVSALDDENGKPIDWWFAYKLPYEAKPPAKTDKQTPVSSGYEYMYYDPGESSLALSPNSLKDSKGAIFATLAGLFGQSKKDPPSGHGWILYDDEIPGTKRNDGTRGHTKGVIGFDVKSDSAFWLLHSTPRYPRPADPGFPSDEKIYGQTFLCVTLPDIGTAEKIAAQMASQQQPQVYGCVVPDGLTEDSSLAALSRKTETTASLNPATVAFKSAGGHAFQCIAKSREWGEDFWIDLVGPELKQDLNVESWRRGKVPGHEEDDGKGDVEDVQYVDLSPLGPQYEWHYTKDHAKWAVSLKSDWVCVADINRMISQEKRGGGTIAFRHQTLWRDLSKIDRSVP